MLVFGDRVRRVQAGDLAEAIAAGLNRLQRLPRGIDRHGALVATFVVAGELAQGLADADFFERSFDAPSPRQDGPMALLMALARAIDDGSLPSLDLLRGLDLRPMIEVKRAEGYAFYALYPEAYLAAARELDPGPNIRVIGIRSIGASLAAAVATAAGAPPPVTVRPVGHPFERRLAVESLPKAERYAVVDEGPGLSGSSFGCVADWLEDHGVAAAHIDFFPSHGGDLGPKASPRHRTRWSRARRHVVDFIATAPLASWVADLVGPAEAPLEELSAGRWRRHRFADPADWPPAHLQQERRKYLLRAGGSTWLLKFAGLGPAGEAKLARAQALAAAGFTPQPAGYRHGFLLERWIEGARPLGVDRRALVAHLGRYLGFRARHFAADATAGASLAELVAMAQHNSGQPDAFGKWLPRLPVLEREVRRIETDSRLQRWEWLCLPDGRLLKTDALDHHDSHDLVGCQDVAWDIAGAATEFELSAAELDELCRSVAGAAGRPVSPRLVAFLLPVYVAFQLGYCSFSRELFSYRPDEANRWARETSRYAKRLNAISLGNEVSTFVVDVRDQPTGSGR